MVSPDYGTIVSTLSVVLGILTYFLTLVQERASTLLESAIPDPAQAAARTKLRGEIRPVLLLGSIPVAAFLCLLLYLCLPTALALVRTGSVAWWSFDLPATLFLLVTLGVAGTATVATAISIKLIDKLRLAS
jgi:hypothetical protein